MADPGEGPGGGAGPPYLSTKLRPKGRKNFFWGDRIPPLQRVWMTGGPPPPYLKVWILHCLTCPKDLVYIYTNIFEIYIEFPIQRLYIVCETVSNHTVIYAPSLHHFDLSF